jgi:hypothetical protein
MIFSFGLEIQNEIFLMAFTMGFSTHQRGGPSTIFHFWLNLKLFFLLAPKLLLKNYNKWVDFL